MPFKFMRTNFLVSLVKFVASQHGMKHSKSECVMNASVCRLFLPVHGTANIDNEFTQRILMFFKLTKNRCLHKHSFLCANDDARCTDNEWVNMKEALRQ